MQRSSCSYLLVAVSSAATATAATITIYQGVAFDICRAAHVCRLRRYRADFLDLGYWEDPERMQDVNVEG